MNGAFPTAPDDPRLENWYHSIDLGDGLHSKGRYDFRSTADLHGLPESLTGKTALDIGTWDGFWAFEMERRGADRVVAIDVERWADFDWLPWIRESKGRQIMTPSDHNFWLAHAMRDSRVERKVCSVYDLSPDTVGTFDVVFCGDLILHLQNPLKALVNVCSVTREMAIVTSLLSEETNQAAPDMPWLSFGFRESESQLGAECIYWLFNTRGLQEIMEYAGFARTRPLEPVMMAPAAHRCALVVGYQDAEG